MKVGYGHLLWRAEDEPLKTIQIEREKHTDRTKIFYRTCEIIGEICMKC